MSWQHTLLDASFKGVPFEVTGDSLKGQHALAEHEYPYVDGADIEDTGSTALEMSLTAVLYGGDYEGRLQSLIKVLRETGAGELVHPVYGSVPDCVVTDFEVRHHEDSPDFAEISMGFKQSVAAAPFFERELPLALADELDFLADLATWQGFAVFEQALAGIGRASRRWNAFHAAVLNVVGVLYAQTGRIYGGVLDLANAPRVLVAELRAVCGAWTQMHRRGGSGLAAWRDTVAGVRGAADTPRQVYAGLAGGAHDADVRDMAALCALLTTVAATETAAEAADILAAETRQALLTPDELARLLADARLLLRRALAANRILALMLAAPHLAQALAQRLLDLDDDTDTLYADLAAAGLLPRVPYLHITGDLGAHIRTMAHTLQKQTMAVINLRPPLVKKTVRTDTSLHLLAFAWYGDHNRQAELLRLNPQIRHPNFIARGSVLNAYAR
ncbi:prophage DNA circulation protein [Neisseria sp. HSC-16F19]|nr:DNA circularization N-terminal domain-containing protein [Neisseria sp. HSC-16F19]MCP2041786.1 prophage DNA circulation protein [Neisseria sp. HSC-16F19]